MKVTAGNKDLDEFLQGGFEKGVVSTIYGAGGSGKTLFLIMCMAVSPKDKKIIFIDTEGGFSPERLQQICPYSDKVLERVILLKPTNFEEQKKAIAEVKSLQKSEISMVLVDTFTTLYRVEMNSADNYELNKDLAKQLRDLVEVARKKDIPVLITTQVYADLEIKDKLNIVGGNIVKNMSKCLLEIRKKDDKRKLIIQKHRSIKEGKEFNFKIVQKGIEKE